MLIGNFSRRIMVIILMINLHTLAWDKFCIPKCEGGLGISKTEDVNAPCLTK